MLKDNKAKKFSGSDGLASSKESRKKPASDEKNIVFEMKNSCPICGGDIKGNDYYSYFCRNCNILFDRKQVVQESAGRKKQSVRERRLTDEEKAELVSKRKELNEKIKRSFSEERISKKETVEKQIPKDTVSEAEIISPHEQSAEEDEYFPDNKEEVAGIIDVGEESGNYVESSEEAGYEAPQEDNKYEDAEAEATPKKAERRESQGLESPNVIVASSESNKMHIGNCHFVKKIGAEKRIYLNSIEQGEEQGYELCVCLRRIKAKSRV